LDDLVSEQQRFQQYSKAISKTRQEHLRWLMKQLQEARDNGTSLLFQYFNSVNRVLYCIIGYLLPPYIC
jgi:hypothetical protein